MGCLPLPVRKLEALRVYLITQAGDGFAWSLITTLNMVYLVTVVDLDPFRLVLVGTVLEISYFLFEIPTGIVADVYSRKLSVVIGFAMVGLGFVIEGSFPVFGIVLIAQVLFGIGATFISGAYEAWIASETRADPNDTRGLGDIYLRGEQVRQIASFLAIGVAVLIGNDNVAIPVVVGGAMLMLLSVFLAVFMPETQFHRVPSQDRETWKSFKDSTKQALRVIRGKRALVSVIVVMLLWGGAAEGFDRLWTIHLIDGYELPAFAGLSLVVWFGIIRAGGMLLSIAGAGAARRWVDTDDDRGISRTMLGITALIATSLVLLAFAPGFLWGVGAVWLIMGARNVLDPLLTTWVNRHSEESVRATVLSAVRQSESLGELAIGPGLGWIASARSIATALTGSALLMGSTVFAWRKATEPTKEQV